jgi:hypothetical protein
MVKNYQKILRKFSDPNVSLDDGLVRTGYSQANDHFLFKVTAGVNTAVKLTITGNTTILLPLIRSRNGI